MTSGRWKTKEMVSMNVMITLLTISETCQPPFILCKRIITTRLANIFALCRNLSGPSTLPPANVTSTKPLVWGPPASLLHYPTPPESLLPSPKADDRYITRPHPSSIGPALSLHRSLDQGHPLPSLPLSPSPLLQQLPIRDQKTCRHSRLQTCTPQDPKRRVRLVLLMTLQREEERYGSSLVEQVLEGIAYDREVAHYPEACMF